MKKIMQKMLGDKAGASAAEYALILAVIGVGVAVAFGQLGGAIKGKVESATSKISTADAS
ncbi:Flp family type IVb pilin [Sandaracinobacter neustonicus]|nr:Flp family type IVb pilin [Sandaracinobacter neustonicus]